MPAALGSMRTTSERNVVDGGIHPVTVERYGAEVEINEGDRRTRMEATSASITRAVTVDKDDVGIDYLAVAVDGEATSASITEAA